MLTTRVLTQVTTLIATGITLYFLAKYASKKVKLEVGGAELFWFYLSGLIPPIP